MKGRNSIITNLQQTLASSVAFTGAGIHTGTACKVVVHAAQEHVGRVFVSDGKHIPALAEYVVDSTRCTTLGNDGARVSTVEHLLAALYACGIDNCMIEVDGPEIPILDGSALPFMQALQQAGVRAQPSNASTVSLDTAIKAANDRGDSQLEAVGAADFSLQIETEFANWPEGNNSTLLEFGSDFMASFLADIAPARTFAFLSEVKPLLDAGLARGGSLDNVVIIDPPATFSSDLRVPGEWWRHKALDVVGDLALVGARLHCKVTALRPGHTANTRLAKALREFVIAGC